MQDLNARNDDAFIGLFTAAGFARRLGSLQGSKELIKVPDLHSNDPGGQNSMIAVGDYLVRQYLNSGINNLLIIRRKEKHDILSHYTSLKETGVFGELSIIDHVIDATPSTCHSIDSAWETIKNHPIAMGFPDMLIQPPGVFEKLKKQFVNGDHDVYLALFPATDPQIWDMVSYDTDTRQVRHLSVKPGIEVTGVSWGCALWHPTFTAFLHDYLSAAYTPQNEREIYMGTIIQAAIEQGLRVSAVPIHQGAVIDIGTPESLNNVLSTM